MVDLYKKQTEEDLREKLNNFPGYRDLEGRPMPSRSYMRLSPLNQIKELGRMSRDLGIDTGVFYPESSDELLGEIHRRLVDTQQRYPVASRYIMDEVPKDLSERVGRAYEMGNRVPASRGMSKFEFEESPDLSFDPLTEKNLVQPRVGRHMDGSRSLIGPQAGWFGNFRNSAPFPLLLNMHPSSTLVVNDTQSNEPVELAEELYRNQMMSADDRTRITDIGNRPDRHKLMNRWLRDHGFQALVYPNDVEGSPRPASRQNDLATRMASRVDSALDTIPLMDRAEILKDIPNPSIVMLDPADIRHMYHADFLKRGLGHKLAIPAAGAAAAYEMLKPEEAEAGDFEAGGQLFENTNKKFMANPFAGQEMGPTEEYIGLPSDKIDNRLKQSFPRTAGIIDALREWGMSPGIIFGDPLDIAAKGGIAAQRSAMQESLGPLGKWALKDLSDDLGWYVTAPGAKMLMKSGQKVAARAVASDQKTAKKRWGKAFETIIEGLGE